MRARAGWFCAGVASSAALVALAWWLGSPYASVRAQIFAGLLALAILFVAGLVLAVRSIKTYVREAYASGYADAMRERPVGVVRPRPRSPTA